MKKEDRHPNIEEIIKVLRHLKTLWKSDATIFYVLETYEKTKKLQEQESRK
jgi:hypothetical protein